MQSVKLIAHTQWSNPTYDTTDSIMAYCARVSNPANQDNLKSDGLLKYCAKNAHWSVFEMASVVMEINTTRDIGRQILRHRSFHFQEFSQRYAQPGTELGHTWREARFQDPKNRQASIALDDSDDHHNDIAKTWQTLQIQVKNGAKEIYDWAIENGIAKEQARVVMPEGITNSRMYMHGTVRDWYHYCQLRMGHGTQKEHQEVAVMCWDILTELYPFLKDVNND